MKTSIFSRVFAALALAALLFATPSIADTVSHGTTTILAQSQSTQVAQPAPAQAPQFDGRKLYKEVFEYLRNLEFTLTDPAVRAKWVAEWENKHANDNVLDTEEGTDKAILEMIQSLGQRFNYYNPPERNKAEREQFDATLVGIGAQLKLAGQAKAIYDARKLGESATEAQLKAIFEPVRKISDTNQIIVDEPMAGGPAEKAGIRKGDKIIKVDGNPVNGKTLDEVVKTIRGKDGSTVKITVLRSDGKGGEVEQTFDITRARVVSHVVKTKDLGNGISYIKLTDFSSQFAEQEMADALTAAAKGKAIVLDLRGNPGGRLDAVETMAQYFLNEGRLITIKQRHGDNTIENSTVLTPEFQLHTQKNSAQPGRIGMKTDQREELIVPADMPIIVLVDEGSASASEILAGLLQANHRAIVVGKTTVGKGVGQALIQLSFDRNIHVTTFEFLPGGVAMDWVGIVPDIEVTNPDEVIIDETKDDQLTAAVKAATEAIAKRDADAKKRTDIRSTNEQAFQKALDAMKNKGTGTTAPAPKK